MAESPPSKTSDPAAPDPGAPIPKDAIDPDLVKLKRARPKIGIVTSAGMVFLCVFFILKLSADRRFGGEDDKPTLVQAADVAAGKVDADSFVEIPAEPMMSHAIRATKAKGAPGLRVVPVRGTNEKLWLALDGGGWEPPATTGRYAGRLRALEDMPFGEAVREHAATHARPVFVKPAALRAGFTANAVKTIDGDQITLRDNDRIALDVIEPTLSIVIATYTPGTPEHDPLLDAGAWQKAIEALGIPGIKPIAADERDKALAQFRFQVQMSVAEATAKLEGAKLWSARVEPVTQHHESPWSALKASPPDALAFGTAKIPDAQVDLVGVYVTRPIPSGALALIVGETPQDYWYILPITIVVGVIGLLFVWALIRGVRRDLLPARA